MEKGLVRACRLQGDFLGLTAVRGLEEVIEGQPYEYRAMEAALARVDLRPYLGGVPREALLSCLFA